MLSEESMANLNRNDDGPVDEGLLFGDILEDMERYKDAYKNP